VPWMLISWVRASGGNSSRPSMPDGPIQSDLAMSILDISISWLQAWKSLAARPCLSRGLTVVGKVLETRVKGCIVVAQVCDLGRVERVEAREELSGSEFRGLCSVMEISNLPLIFFLAIPKEWQCQMKAPAWQHIMQYSTTCCWPRV
jgi:hypothetical protein